MSLTGGKSDIYLFQIGSRKKLGVEMRKKKKIVTSLIGSTWSQTIILGRRILFKMVEEELGGTKRKKGGKYGLQNR